ncbi:hypothetical protein C3Y87_03170 [Carbonactinospora thermoautotrophica]|uniref:DUF6247 family protein n=1 Tax=Carbonactinospora thermoautotrophica TaxID=1469144 RepID=UPI002271EEEC|nr:DUF6247 family protein [Carbonactinospora thermoautotrophica]MCX9190433.1 hypothetical protein [Carbonactinospora thermoautotrophica]
MSDLSDDIPVVTPYAPRVEKTPAAVREALDEDLRAEYAAEWAAALDKAKESFDLVPAFDMLERWWPVAQVCQQPGGRQAVEQGTRDALAGVPGIPFDLDGED